VIRIDAEAPDPESLDRAAAVIAGGGVVALLFETLYGLAADAMNPAAVERIQGLKGRDAKPPPLIIGWAVDLIDLVKAPPPAVLGLIETFWPGPLTLVFQAKGNRLAPACRPGGKVGLRLSPLALPTRLAQAVGRPLTATSANPTGAPPATTAAQVEAYFGDEIDLILDSGLAASATPSTVVDVTGQRPRVLRPGLIPEKDITAVWDAGGR
jgi:L-threonylcarbamoyladenylate synthase